MDSFNSMPGLSGAANPGSDPLSGLTMGGQPGQHPHGLGLDGFDPHNLPFDDPYLDNVNPNIHGLPSLPFTPSYDFDTFSSTFEDPFSYPSTARYDALNGPGPGGAPFDMAHPCGGTLGAGDDEEGSSPQDLDTKLLGFSAPIAGAAPALIDEASGASVEPSMTAELFGMFFVAEDVYASDQNVGRPLELTCYRRNLWQCSGQITLPRFVAAMVDAEGRSVPVTELAASISAIESIEGKPTEIISIPWKSSNPNATSKDGGNGGNGAAAGAGATDETKIAGPPPNVAIDLSAATEIEGQPGKVTVSVSWKRLQFKHATANNGRRKGLQQHYVVQINLLGRAKEEGSGAGSGTAAEWIKIAEIQSGPVIVRGRSPRNFDSRKDVPLNSGDKKQQQQQVQQQQHLQAERRRLSAENLGGLGGVMAASSPAIKQDRSDLAANLQKYHSLGNVQAAPDWASHQSYSHVSQQQHPSKKVAVSPTVTRPPVPAWSSSESITSLSGNTPSRASSSKNNSAVPRTSVSVSTLPISLSLSEDERSPPTRDGTSTSSPQHARAGRTGSGASSSIAAAAADAMGLHLPSVSSQNDLENDDGEMLYEYFPLSLDDWMQPVDAIYRPHVVHHTNALPDAKAQPGLRQGKRYFLAE